MKNRLTVRLSLGLLVLGLMSLPLHAQSRRKSSAKAEEWNQWRGPNRDGLSTETGLLKQWPSGGPKLLWKVTGIGKGYSSVCVSGDLLFIQGEVRGKSGIMALKAADGKKVWETQIGEGGGERPGQVWDGPRASPATDGRHVYALCQAGEIVAVQAKTGRIAWKANIEGLGGRRPTWWWSESPLLDGNLVLVTPGGGGGTVVALNKANGKPVWKSKRVKGTAHYTSIAIGQLGGRLKQYIVLTDQAVAGLHSKNGAVLWEASRRGRTAVIPTPIYHKDGFVFVTSGYGVGHNGFQVRLAGNRVTVKEIYKGDELGNHHGGVVLVGDHIYGLADNGGLKCLDVKTGEQKWANGSVGKGSTTYADGHLIVRSERSPGAVALVEATPEGYKEKGRFTPPDPSGDRTWTHPVVAGGKLYLRDHDVLLCYDVKAQ